MFTKKIQSALISVFHKDGLEPIVRRLYEQDVKIYSTGVTGKFIKNLGIEIIPVEHLTNYPAIFGGRVKTLHPKVFGGILHRRDNESDWAEARDHEIPLIDLVIVDLYPFEATVASGACEEAVIEQIDIGGIALIRAGAKNYKDVMTVSSREYYGDFLEILDHQKGETTEEQRKRFAATAFATSGDYDAAIFNYMNEEEEVPPFRVNSDSRRELRYGENPHQKGCFYGDLSEYFDQIQGKELSYNNLVDIEAAVRLTVEFDEIVFGILKHTNACGIATGTNAAEAYQRAFAADTVSAFGGVLVTNAEVNKAVTEELNRLFFEILIAPSFSKEALESLKTMKNRILIIQKKTWHQTIQYKSLLNGTIVQDYDLKSETKPDLVVRTKKAPNTEETDDLIFAAKVCKHSKSNAIVLAKGGQLLASGVGQTSRVDALNQAIEKAERFGFNLDKAVMASDAFFPFPDCVEIAHKAGITSIIQPGGSIKDQDSIDYCDVNGLAMVITGARHFKH